MTLPDRYQKMEYHATLGDQFEPQEEHCCAFIDCLQADFRADMIMVAIYIEIAADLVWSKTHRPEGW